jgi:hypothetical protein
VYLGGIRVLSERDRLPRARASVGIWVGGDSTVMFDDFRIEDETEDAPGGTQAPTAKPRAARGEGVPASGAAGAGRGAPATKR